MRATTLVLCTLGAFGCAGNSGEHGRTASEPRPSTPPLSQVNPPLAPGASSTELTGCLAKRGATRRIPPPPIATPEVVVLPQGRELRIKHTLNHACCLTGEVSTEVEGNTVTVTEVLSGNACRCNCSSVLTTRVALPLGSYEVRVLLRDRDTPTEEVSRSTVTLQGLRPSPAASDPPENP